MAAVDYNAGRIPKTTLYGCTIALFALVMFAAFTRFWIKLRIQRQFQIDDAFIIVGLGTLTSAFVILFTYTEQTYTVEEIVYGGSTYELPDDFVRQAATFKKWVTISMILLWVTITCVKFSFLCLFRRLIDHLGGMMIYWYIVCIYTTGVFGYGITTYILPCSDFSENIGALACGLRTYDETFRGAVIQMSLDAFGDLLIVLIPIRIIWQIKIRPSQKVALVFSLCLTIVVMVTTIIRASGIRLRSGSIDTTWEIFWAYISSEVGLILSSAMVFRSFFVKRKAQLRQHAPRELNWYVSRMHFLKGTLSRWRRRSSESRSGSPNGGGEKNLANGHGNGNRDGNGNPGVNGFARPQRRQPEIEMPTVPRPVMTGIRSFINHHRRSRYTASQIMHSRTHGTETENENEIEISDGSKDGSDVDLESASASTPPGIVTVAQYHPNKI